MVQNTLKRNLGKKGQTQIRVSRTYLSQGDLPTLHYLCTYRSTAAPGDQEVVLGSSISITNNNQISIAPYGHNFRGAGGRLDQCSVKV